MGYTHYWSINIPKGKAKQIELAYRKAIIKCQRLAVNFQMQYGGIAGYAAHTKPGTYGGLDLNGKGGDAHENFVMREHARQNKDGRFCKTARKPYDTLIVACLIVLKTDLGNAFIVGSDGNSDDWIEGLSFARRTIKNKALRIPESIRKAGYYASKI